MVDDIEKIKTEEKERKEEEKAGRKEKQKQTDYETWDK